MSRREVMEAIKSFGLTARFTPDGEYRINTRGGTEATAYYTDDPQDAIQTARLIATAASAN